MGAAVSLLLLAGAVQPQPLYDPQAVNNPALNDPVKLNDKGPAVLRAQILLARARFSCGEIDGHFGPNLERALRAFLQSRGLPAAPVMTPEVWGALSADTAPALIEYTIAAEDVAGPFVKVPADMLQKARLQSLGYESAAEALGEKFHSSPKLLAQLNPQVSHTAGARLVVPNVLVMPPPKAASVLVSQSQSAVIALDSAGKVLAWYAASTGSEHDPLPIGEWKILGVRRLPEFHYNPKLFWDAKPGHTKAKIAPGPNNPAGVVWIDLSKEHYGIHGTPEPSKIGHGQSHGCIRLTNWDASELASMVAPGMRAVLQE